MPAPVGTVSMRGQNEASAASLQTDPAYRRRYDDFVAAMVYGEKWKFDDAIRTVAALSDGFLKD